MILDARLPKRVGLGHVLGAMLGASILLQAVTGALMSMYYAPNPDHAYESVKYIDEQISAGAVVRGLHHWGASATIVLMIAHLLATFVRGAHSGERRWTWVGGVGLLLVLLGLGFTGYLLPWDLKAYFGLQVGAQMMPESLRPLMLGGPTMEPWTLQRLFTLHAIVLPGALALGVVVHAVQVARRGLHGLPAEASAEAGEPLAKSFHPDLLPKIAGAVLVLVLALTALAMHYGAPLEPKADPANTTFNAYPEWYFFGLKQLLEITGVTAGRIVPALLIVLIAAAPWIKSGPRARLGAAATLLSAWIGMTVWGWAAWRSADVPTPVDAGANTAWIADPQRVERGEHLYFNLNCHLCHQPDMPDVPNLDDAGGRLNPVWTAEYLRKPWRIRWKDRDVRPVMRMPHYSLTDAEARDLAAYLNTAVDESRVPPTGIDWAAPRPDLEARGRELFDGLECAQCHRIGSAGFNTGPELTRAGHRARPDYLYAVVRDAKALNPRTEMKVYDLPPADLEAIARYLRTLK